MHNRKLAGQVVGKQQFGVIVDGFEQEGEFYVQIVAGSNQQQPKHFVLRIGRRYFAIQQIIYFSFVNLKFSRNVSLFGFVQQFGQRVAILWRNDAHAGRLVFVGIHKPEGHQTVEPGIGHLFDKQLFACAGNLFLKFPNLFGLLAQRNAICIQHIFYFGSHLLDEFAACLLRESFKLVCVHFGDWWLVVGGW